MFKTKTILTLLFIVVTAGSVSAQDLLAKQAPVDRQMRAVDSVALEKLFLTEAELDPASELYADWDNVYAHRATALPDSLLIDLRDFTMPTPSRIITSNFGRRWGRQHKGLDIKVYIGDTIRAAFSGKVRIVRYERGGYGKYIVIRHPNGLETIYGHLSKQLVVEDQIVKSGDVIGLGGNTGRSTGSHLHFETRLCGVALNPALMFDFRNQDVVGDYYTFHKNSYQAESAVATRLRGVNGLGEKGYAAAAPEADYEQADRYHKVKSGENLSIIAKKHGTTVDALCKKNHIKKTMRLLPGQILKY